MPDTEALSFRAHDQCTPAACLGVREQDLLALFGKGLSQVGCGLHDRSGQSAQRKLVSVTASSVDQRRPFTETARYPFGSPHLRDRRLHLATQKVPGHGW
jgi:hypothetical protein